MRAQDSRLSLQIVQIVLYVSLMPMSASADVSLSCATRTRYCIPWNSDYTYLFLEEQQPDCDSIANDTPEPEISAYSQNGDTPLMPTTASATEIT
jgi:hypothetical protein